MAEQIQQQQIQEQQPEQDPDNNEEGNNLSDHIPLKDQFSSDLSEIDLAQYAEKQEEEKVVSKANQTKSKKKKIVKNYRWKNKWIKINNIIEGSGPILQQKWIKVKYVPAVQEQVPCQTNENKGALQIAHAIMFEQLNQKK